MITVFLCVCDIAYFVREVPTSQRGCCLHHMALHPRLWEYLTSFGRMCLLAL